MSPKKKSSVTPLVPESPPSPTEVVPDGAAGRTAAVAAAIARLIARVRERSIIRTG